MTHHRGDPCVHCGLARDAVPVGECRGKAKRIAEIEERARAATEGPWRANLHHTQQFGGRTYAFVIDRGIVPLAAVTLGVEGMPEDEGQGNATFIAHAREDIPWLIGQLRAALASVSAPPGFVLVPVEPTEAMVEAGEREVASLDRRFDSDRACASWVWEAMIAASGHGNGDEK